MNDNSGTIRYAEEAGRDYYLIFLSRYYFPFVLKFRLPILGFWVCVFAVSLFFGPQFLAASSSDLSVPPGCPSANALDAFKRNYPTASILPPAVVVFYSPGGNIIGSGTKRLSIMLDQVVKQRDEISYALGYWQLIANNHTYFDPLRVVSASNQIMITQVNFQSSATMSQTDKPIKQLMTFANENCSPDIEVYTTGLLALFKDMGLELEADLAVIDGTCLPLALIILGFNLKTWRHPVIAICTVACSLLLAFSFMLALIKAGLSVDPIAPSIMITLGIAVCFDYSLFILNRFKEEVSVLKKTKETGVFYALATAGHVVGLSGLTLFFSFALLILFRQGFIQSVGWGCATVVLCSVITNLTLTPCLLLTFDVFIVFEPYPTTIGLPSCLHAVFCCSPRPSWSILVDKQEPAVGQVSLSGSSSSAVISDDAVNVKSDIRNDEICQIDSFSTTSKLHAGSSISDVKLTDVRIRRDKNVFFRLAYYSAKYPLVFLFLSCCIMAPMAWLTFEMNPTSDSSLLYLEGSPSLKGLKLMQGSFALGSLDPYSLLVVPGIPSSVLTREYFRLENQLVNMLLLGVSKDFISSSSVSALSYYKGQNISYDLSLKYLMAGSDLYDSLDARAYRAEAASRMNKDRSASIIRIETVSDPSDASGAYFVRRVRSILAYIAEAPEGKYKGLSVDYYLFGGYTTTLDVQNALYEIVPIMIGATIGVVLFIVGINFGSVLIPLRLIFTIAISLAVTYGLAVVVYQPGPGSRAFTYMSTSLKHSSGIYWIIPIMTFSILVGLAMDYDIFIMARVVEFRRMGWSDSAAISLAVEKSGAVVSAAGLIMSISFAGLLFPKVIVENQYGFILLVGVAVDTFFVRLFVVPAIISIASVPRDGFDINWWPCKMDPPVMSFEAEEEALFEGYWEPPIVDRIYAAPTV